MQIDSLTKDPTIKSVVKHLASKYGFDSFKLRDYWEGDLCAIGLSDIKEKHLIYISTFGKAENHFFIELENTKPDETDDFPYVSVGEYDNISLDELENHFAQHLEIKSTTHNTR